MQPKVKHFKSERTKFGTLSNIRKVLMCRCPVCGKGNIFDRFLAFKERCDHCDFDLGSVIVGDGAVYTTLTVISSVVASLVVVIDIIFMPPLWVTFTFALVAVILGSLFLYRWSTALFLLWEVELVADKKKK